MTKLFLLATGITNTCHDFFFFIPQLKDRDLCKAGKVKPAN